MLLIIPLQIVDAAMKNRHTAARNYDLRALLTPARPRKADTHLLTYQEKE